MKYEQPLNHIGEILSARLFSDEERAIAINRFLSEEGSSNEIFRAVLNGELTFEKYVREYTDDLNGLGLLKRWKLSSEPSQKFIENISLLFNTRKHVGVRGLPIYKNLAEEMVTRPEILTPLIFFSFTFAFCALLLIGLARFFFNLSTYPPVLWVTTIASIVFSAWGTYCTADAPFDDRRAMGESLLLQAKELDTVIQTHYKKGAQNEHAKKY